MIGGFISESEQYGSRYSKPDLCFKGEVRQSASFLFFIIFISESLKTTITLMMDTRSNANYELTDANLHDGKILSMFLHAIFDEQ